MYSYALNNRNFRVFLLMDKCLVKLKNLITYSAFLLASCSFNKEFLVPQKIPQDAKIGKFVSSSTGDTTFVSIGQNYQPTFRTNKPDTTQQTYTIESVIFRSKSGNNINGWFINPHKFNSINIIFLHGNGGNIMSEYVAMIPLVERGFRVFAFDYSGYGFSDGQATRENSFKDAASALDFAVLKLMKGA